MVSVVINLETCMVVAPHKQIFNQIKTKTGKKKPVIVCFVRKHVFNIFIVTAL